MSKFMKKLMKKDGFTLVELIVVIAILAILAGVAIPAYSGYITKAQDAAVITELDAIQTAAQGANAAAGEISKIEVETVSEKTQIKVTFTGDATNGFDRAAKFGQDFELYYGGKAEAPANDGSVTITVDNEILDGSYAEGATWENGEWAENCDHVDANTDHTCDRTGCGATVGEHKAADGGNTCSYCKKEVTANS